MNLSKHEHLVNGVINGTSKITNKAKYGDFTAKELRALQEEYDSRMYLTVAEAAIWLGVSIETIYRMIEKNRIVANRITSNNGPYRINVEATRELLART